MSPPRRPRTPAGPTPVDALRHRDTRANIPTGELRDFVAADETAPPEALYPRDPSLDPQLVWRGKAEQDAADLAVPSVPVYIQETVQPRAIIENLRDTASPGEDEPELTLFDDLYEPDLERRVDFYAHQDPWKNRLILGDSLLVMNSLAEKEALRGGVQMIYLDPPYGIRFGSNWQVSTRKRDVKDGKVDDATRQPEQIKAFRDTWALGIHSYLTYLRDRLTVARELLTESGSIFVQIGDENVHLVRSLMDEVFGSENFVSQIAFKKTGGQSSTLVAGVFDYLIVYAKGIGEVKHRPLFTERAPGEEGSRQYTWVELDDGQRREMTQDERVDGPPSGARIFQPYPLVSMGPAAQPEPFEWRGKTYHPSPGRHWSITRDGLQQLDVSDRLMAIGSTLRHVNYVDDYPVSPVTNLWTDTQTSGFAGRNVYVVQTLAAVVQRCLLMATDAGDLVLDPTCGSGTTAFIAEQFGRRWITIDTSRVALALARTRLMAARYPYYRLADPEGDVRRGFEYRTVPHVTLRSIAQNPDIREGMSRDQIDAAIARHAEREVLVDQPFEDRGRVRVTGPFTVESVSPHRVAVADDEAPPSGDGVAATGAGFVPMILDNLRRAGVQNTVKQEHLDLDLLESFAGAWLHARGEFVDAGGDRRTVGVSIGPEHGTVDAEQVREAAKEALRGAGVDLLLVCGFAFDPDAGEKAAEFRPAEAGGGWAVAAEERRLGRLPVLLVRMNPDLSMGEDLLKKTGAGNLFMVFGEPDVEIARADDGRVEVEIRGLDVYDPTTGQLRSGSVDDIACWMIDTDYDGESLFVRHAYFLGADDPYANLRRALRADIDEAAWATLYSARSRPFAPPASGRIAVKVINHYGDEVLKVYEVR